MLTPEQEAWLQARVHMGDFDSIEQAARQLLDERIAERAAEERRDTRRETLWVGELSNAEIEAIASARMDIRHKHLDAELS